jgi:hypothetical protein
MNIMLLYHKTRQIYIYDKKRALFFSQSETQSFTHPSRSTQLLFFVLNAVYQVIKIPYLQSRPPKAGSEPGEKKYWALQQGRTG